jgi:hypothetical protein
MYSQIDKCKVFFENISPKITTDTLKTYLSKEYQIKTCIVKHESGENKLTFIMNERNYGVFLDQNKGHGTVIFSDMANVNKLMGKRPHYIDGTPVEIYRSVSNQGPLKEKMGVTNLIVSGIKDKLSHSDLHAYFENYGKIDHIVVDEEDNSCRIVFNE